MADSLQISSLLDPGRPCQGAEASCLAGGKLALSLSNRYVALLNFNMYISHLNDPHAHIIYLALRGPSHRSPPEKE